MQYTLKICACDLSVNFNFSKSFAVRIGLQYKRVCSNLILCRQPVAYADSVIYLGVELTSDKTFTCFCGHVKFKFYRV